MSPKILNILLIISSLALYYLVVTPMYSGVDSGVWLPENNIQSLLVYNKNYDQTLNEVDALIVKAKNIQTAYENVYTPEIQHKLSIMVPDTINETKLYNEIDKFQSKTGQIDNIGVKDKGLGEYSVSFSVTTTYTKFKEIMTEWEKSMRLFSLKGVSFSPGKTEEDPIKFTVDMSTYYLNFSKK